MEITPAKQKEIKKRRDNLKLLTSILLTNLFTFFLSSPSIRKTSISPVEIKPGHTLINIHAQVFLDIESINPYRVFSLTKISGTSLINSIYIKKCSKPNTIIENKTLYECSIEIPINKTYLLVSSKEKYFKIAPFIKKNPSRGIKVKKTYEIIF